MSKFKLILSFWLAGIFGFAGIVSADVTDALLPVGNGYWSRFWPHGSASHYQNVDDSPCNGITDYNSTSTSGYAKESYILDLSSVPNGSTITRIDVSPCASTDIDGMGSSTLNIFWRWNGLDSPMYGNLLLYNTTFSQHRAVTVTNLSLLKNSDTRMEIGVYHNAGNLGVRISNVKTWIYYTP